MSVKRLVLVIIVLILINPGWLRADSDLQESLGLIERLWSTYNDAQQSPAQRAQDLEQIIATYQRILAQQMSPLATVSGILDGEIKWRLALAQALLTERTIQARLAVEDLGLGGDWASDLSSTISRADKVLEQIIARLDQLIQYMRADEQFERNYVVTGLYLRANRAKTIVDYYQGWSYFYRALLTEEQTKRQELLQASIEHLRGCCTDQPGESGPGQPGGDREQAMLRGRAVLLMVKALHQAGRLGEADKLLTWLERQSLDEQLAYEVGLQRCRLLRDQGYHDTALAGLEQLRNWCRKKQTIEQLPVRLTLAYLECTIQSAKAQTAADRGDLAKAGEFSRQRLAPLAEIFQAQANEQVRAIIYEQISRTRLAGSSSKSGIELTGLEGLAMAVDLARQGHSTEALKLFDGLLSRTDSGSRILYPEVLWQAGKTARESNPLQACSYLGRLTDDFPDSPQAQQAVLLAVEIAAKFRAQKPNEPAAEKVCFTALQRLMTKYPTNPQAQHWRFYWADLLHSRGDLTNAAEQFALIPQSDPQYVGARYYQFECRRQLLDNSENKLAADKAAKLTGLAKEFLSLDRYVLAPVSPANHRDKTSRSYGALARLAAVRILCTDLDESQTGLMLLGTFSADYADQSELIARAVRYRIAALAKLGRLNEAANLALSLLRDGQADSAKIADSVLLHIREKFADSDSLASSDQDKELTHSWVQLAKARLDFTEKSVVPPQQKEQELLIAREMLGRALFAAGELEEALTIFNKLSQQAPNSAEYIRMSGKILLAQKNYDAAGRQWLRLIQGLKADSPEWFEAWYWGLRTNFEAGGDRQTIIRRIKQLQSLDAKMGSEQTRTRFESLIIELERAATPAG